ncbi:MAG: membrane protein of unknown function [Promethearchaeota archaeon]|nr:MAG: membrane protein of unknown function [Candidatus Lokiarchaeota archaeon]
MSENSSLGSKIKEGQERRIREYFDGIKFLWNTPETRFLLNLVIILVTSIGIFFIINYILLQFFSGNLIVSIITVNSLYFFMGFFIFVMLELLVFYMKTRKHPLKPEKVEDLLFPSQKGRGRQRFSHIVLLILGFGLGIIVDLLDLFFFGFLLGNSVFLFSIFYLGFVPVLYGIVFIVSFLAVKGSMESFADNYLDKFRERKSYIALAYPVPFIITIILFYFPRIDVLLFDLGAFFFFVYVLISLLGIFYIIKSKWRLSYAVTSFAASYTLLFSIIIPSYIGTIIDFLGVFVSFGALCFFFIQGQLDGSGDELREFYQAWDEKLNSFNIRSHEDLENEQKRAQLFDTPLDPEIEKAYPKTILSIMLITVLMFGLIFQIMSTLLIIDPSSAVTVISLYIDLFSFLEFLGLITSTIIFIIVIVKRETKKLSKNEKETENTITCPYCNKPTTGKNFCEHCGKKIRST